MSAAKPFSIPKELIWNAYKQVKTNGGSYGVDNESIAEFETNLKKNLYKLWNRMSSGSYFPPSVRGVPIPKKTGGIRLLGVPTVSDRIAQTAAKMVLEALVEPIFHENSYGYRPNRSAHDAIEITRSRCWEYPWVVEFDIKGLFDNIDHDLMMKAVRKHCNSPWVLLYIERWLKASIVLKDGSVENRVKGTPQGGCVSPVLANLFLHYAFDMWATRKLPGVKFCRYADDGLLHCRDLKQAEEIMKALTLRMRECGLEIHPLKSKIVYCKTGFRHENHKTISFTFLGYKFMPRAAKNSRGKQFLSFSPGVSNVAMKAMKQKLRQWKLQLKNEWSLDRIARFINPVLRGWYQYYGRFYKSALKRLWLNVNDYLCRWVMRKHRKLNRHRVKSFEYLAKVAASNRNLFVHWQHGYVPTV